VGRRRFVERGARWSRAANIKPERSGRRRAEIP
jgi:hypothetical protein